MKNSPLIWIIDEEWSDYDFEAEYLRNAWPNCEIRYSNYNYLDDLMEFGKDADAILAQIYTDIPSDVIEKLNNCKGIAVYGGGYDRVDIKAAKQKGIKVTNVSDYCKEDVSDYVLTGIFYFNKQINSFKQSNIKGIWGSPAIIAPSNRINTLTLFIIGFGRIGRVVCQKARALNMNVIAYDPYVDIKTIEGYGAKKVELDQGLESSDFVSLHCILNEETLHMITLKDFKKMKKSAYFINCARGKIVAESDLIKAVDKGLIAGALVDVIENEPPLGDESILKCEKIIVTPHISYISQQSYRDLKLRALENLNDMLKGNRPKDLVNG